MVGPGDLEGVSCSSCPQTSYCLLETHFFRVKTISRMGSSGFWSQFVCGKFLLGVQKKAVSSPEGQIFMEPAAAE